MTSIFTRIARKELPAHIVWEDAEFMSLMSIKPVSSGHLLLAPKAQVDTIYNLTERAYYRLWQIVRFLEAPLQRAIGAPRIGIAFEGFGVAHAHVHLIPVYRLGDLDPRRATLAAFEDLRPIAERIRAEIASEPALPLGM